MENIESPKQAIIRLKEGIKEQIKDKKILKVIEEVIDLMPRLNKEIHHINQGGCGVFSLLLWSKLKKLGYTDMVVVPFLIAMPFGGGVDLDAAAKNFNEVAAGNADYEVPWQHMMLAFIDKANDQSILIDSETVEVGSGADIVGQWENPVEEIGKPISFETLTKLAGMKLGWNTDFDRKQIPALAKIIDTLK